MQIASQLGHCKYLLTHFLMTSLLVLTQVQGVMGGDLVIEASIVDRLPVGNQVMLRKLSAIRNSGSSNELQELLKKIINGDTTGFNKIGQSKVLDDQFSVKLKSGGTLIRIPIDQSGNRIEELFERPIPGDIILLKSQSKTKPLIFVGNGGFPSWKSGQASYFYFPYSLQSGKDEPTFEINSFPPRFTKRLLHGLDTKSSIRFSESSPSFAETRLTPRFGKSVYSDFYVASKTWSAGPTFQILRPAVPKDVEETLGKLSKLRLAAKGRGCGAAVAALDHYLDLSGAFVEIPNDKAMRVRNRFENQHRERTIEKIFKLRAAEGQFAMDALAASGTNFYENDSSLPLILKGSDGFHAKPESKWPKSFSFKMHFANGPQDTEGFCDMLEYAGEVINSELTIEARRIDTSRCFELQIVNWKSWVVDNYDWEGDKALGIGGNSWRGGISLPFVPSQQEMNHLQKVGFAKPFQRSSRSWQVTDRRSFKVCFDDDESIKTSAIGRRLQLDSAKQTKKLEEDEGALSISRPAEEVQAKMTLKSQGDIVFWASSFN
jgi:hypothetical protein